MELETKDNGRPGSAQGVMEQDKLDTLIGRYVGKAKGGKGRILLGKVISCEQDTGFFTVSYEDGSHDQLDRTRLESILMVDGRPSNAYLNLRKRKLDQIITTGEGGGGGGAATKRPNTRSRRKNGNAAQAQPSSVSNNSVSEDAPTVSEGCPASSVSHNLVSGDVSEEDTDSSGYSDDNDRASPPASSSLPEPIIVPLPPSSGDLSVPEESVSYLFSVYSFLKSFSHLLFLSPFGLDDFMGCLNCTVPNSLLDAIHLSLMKVLRRHLQTVSSDGSEIASKCLRHCDWTLLDALTWPAVLLEYLLVMRYKYCKFCVTAGEYYGLPASVKLKVLQILCDDVVDSAELRTEFDSRLDNMGEEDGYDASDSILPESGPRRVHPRYSKTSACKNLEALENSVESKLPNSDSKVLDMVDASAVGQDGNSDECQLCGMNGSLVCCDGCPSAYHIRCIGLYKTFLPEGLWFCPECTVNKLGMTSSRVGRGASGAEIFGTDATGRVFLGTCNYLLVIGASLDSQSICRYYNQDDVSKVLTAICLTAENASLYADICRGISKYWEVPLVAVQSGKPEPIRDLRVDKEANTSYISSLITLPKGTAEIVNEADTEKCMTSLGDGSPSSRAGVCRMDCSTEAKGNSSTLELVVKAELPDSEKYATTSHGFCSDELPKADDKTFCAVEDMQSTSVLAPLTVQKISPSTNTMTDRQLGNESVVTDNLPNLKQTISAKRLTFSDAATSALENESGMCKEEAGSSIFSSKKGSVSIPAESRNGCHNNDDQYRIKSQRSSSIQSVFKPQAYINLYVQGDVAASAAAYLAVQASEESKVSEAQASSNLRKIVAAKTALEMKAFSMATSEFSWPSFEKVVEIPRARCGWCSACNATYKKGCLLNLASNKSIKRFAKSVSGLRLIKPIDSHLPSIAAQIAFMEESLQGLMDGPLSTVAYNRQWRKLIRETSSCRVLKFLLLELEKSIRGISFSAEWTKLVDDWVEEFSSATSGVSCSAPSQKHGPGRRRKQMVVSEAEHDSSSGSSKTLQWWRGGRLSKAVFQKGTLCSSLVKKVGRQGGSKRIPGIHYPEVSELPRRSRQLAWRASVEMSKNASQLALQVRYLDAHVRWRDIARPEQNPSDGKGSDVDAMAFRNAVICDKRIAENKTSYALTFAIQKHLSLRVSKNILETEKAQDGNDKFWFSENHVPLYLIKEYEEKAGMKPSTGPPLNCVVMLRVRRSPKPEIRQLKSLGDTFTYLIHRRDAVRCSACRVYYQKDCTVTSPAGKEGDLELFTCMKCYRVKFASLVGSNNRSLNRQLPSQEQNQQQPLHGQNQKQPLQGQNHNQSSQRPIQQLTSTKCILKIGHHMLAQSVGKNKMEVKSDIMHSASGSKSERKHGRLTSPYGLIWKRKKGDDPGNKDFRINNIILTCKEGTNPLKGVTCSLCNKPYRSDLIYICCETCHNWYHADAVELEEAQIFDLAGFKCCKCRRKRLPKCPHSDLDHKISDMKQATTFGEERNTATPPQAQNLVHSTTLESNSKVEYFGEDPLLCSLGRVDPIEEVTMEAKVKNQEKLSFSTQVQFGEPSLMSKSQQKLSVRRPQVKHERVEPTEGATMDTEFQFDEPRSMSKNQQKLSVSRPHFNHVEADCGGTDATTEVLKTEQVEWDSPQNWGYADGDLDSMVLEDESRDPEIGITDMEFEPQTYFSFTELLASDDGQMDDLYDMPTNMSGDGSFDNSQNINQDVLPYNSYGDYDMGTESQYAVANKTPLDGAACHKCKLNEPSPDLVCDNCKMCIHSHCSPWEDAEVAQWRCGDCRDWR